MNIFSDIRKVEDEMFCHAVIVADSDCAISGGMAHCVSKSPTQVLLFQLSRIVLASVFVIRRHASATDGAVFRAQFETLLCERRGRAVPR